MDTRNRGLDRSGRLLTPNLNAIRVLMYLVQYTRLDVPFAINVLARYRSKPTQRHWNGVKHVIRYLRGTVNMDFILF